MVLRTPFGSLTIDVDYVVAARKRDGRFFVDIRDVNGNTSIPYTVEVTYATYVGVLEMLDDWNNPNKF